MMLIVNPVLSRALIRRAREEACPSHRVKRRMAATAIQMAVRRYLYRMKVERRTAVTAELRRVQAAVEQYLLAKKLKQEYKEQEEVLTSTSELSLYVNDALHRASMDDDVPHSIEHVGEAGRNDVGVGVGGSHDVEEVGVGSTGTFTERDDDDDASDDGDGSNNGEEVGEEGAEGYHPEEDDDDHCDTCACVEGWLGGIIKFLSGMFGHRNTGNAMGPPTTPPPRAVIDGGYLSSSSPPVPKRQRRDTTSPTAARAAQRGIAYGGDLTSPSPARAAAAAASSPTPAVAAAAASCGENLTPSQQNQQRHGGVTESTRKPGLGSFYDDEDDISSMRIRHLKEELQSYHIPTDSFLDKESLVEAVRTARREASSTSTLRDGVGTGKPKDEEVRSAVGKPKEEEGDSGSDSDSVPPQRRPTGVTTDGSDVWNHYASEGEFGTRLEWRAGVENIRDCVGQWFSLQPEWTQGANILTAGSQAILPSTLGHNGLPQVTTAWGGHFVPLR